MTGSYTPPVNGIYIVSINNYLKNTTNADTTSISLIDSGMTNALNAHGSYGTSRTMLATAALYLNSTKSLSYQLNGTAFQSHQMDAGWSLYFIKTLDLVKGFSGGLSQELTISSINTWVSVSNLSASSSSGFWSVANALVSSYSASEAGAYFVSFTPLFTHSAESFVKVSVSVNSIRLLVASSFYGIPNQKMTVPVSGTLKLNVGDVVTFQVYSSVVGVKVSTQSSASLVFVEGRSFLISSSLSFSLTIRVLIDSTSLVAQAEMLFVYLSRHHN